MQPDAAVHSDLLVHWTGKDIDRKYHRDWYDRDHGETCEEAAAAYISRLRDILTFGMWLTVQPGWAINDTWVPESPALCFTELKLSQTRHHASLYGRLGIAVKRPFLFNRLGRPVVYFHPSFPDRLLQLCTKDLSDRGLLQFFRPMETQPRRRLTYDLYSESEWRIIGGIAERRDLVDPRANADSPSGRYFAGLSLDGQETLRYLAPLDGWLAAIIYPNVVVKVRATEDVEVRDLIAAAKRRGGCPPIERRNWPVELDLDLCRNL